GLLNHVHSFPTRRSSDLQILLRRKIGDEMEHFDKKQHYLGQILAADPGHMRFKNAVKATAGLGFSAFTTLFLLFLMDDIQLTPRSEEHTSELQSRFDLVC